MMGSPLEVRAEGVVVHDERGAAMLDCGGGGGCGGCGGYGVFILGHCHPRVVEAARRQLETHPVCLASDDAATTSEHKRPARVVPLLAVSWAQRAALTIALSRAERCGLSARIATQTPRGGEAPALWR